MLMTERQLRKAIRRVILITEGGDDDLLGDTTKPSSKPSDEDGLLGDTTKPSDKPSDDDDLLGDTTAPDKDPEDLETRIDSIEDKVDQIIKAMKEKMK